MSVSVSVSVYMLHMCVHFYLYIGCTCYITQIKGEIEAARESYHSLEVAEAAVHKAKKIYEAAHHDHTALQYELTTLQSTGVAGKIEKVCLFILERNCSIDECDT